MVRIREVDNDGEVIDFYALIDKELGVGKRRMELKKERKPGK